MGRSREEELVVAGGVGQRATDLDERGAASGVCEGEIVATIAPAMIAANRRFAALNSISDRPNSRIQCVRPPSLI